MDSTGVTEYPPGPNLSRLGQQKVFVTRPGNDNIGEILTSMGVEFEPFQGSFDCSLLFVNCNTPDRIDPQALADFVDSGGCVYASCYADAVISDAFPGVFKFGGHVGRPGRMVANVIDSELRSVLGAEIEVVFDTTWATLRSGKKAEILLTAAKGCQQAGPIMAYADHGAGSIFFTCFHNKAQTSDREKRLLQLLVVKQFSTRSQQSFEQTGKNLGLAFDQIRNDLRA